MTKIHVKIIETRQKVNIHNLKHILINASDKMNYKELSRIL